MSERILPNSTTVRIKVDAKRIASEHWSPEVVSTRRQDGLGVIKCHHDSHGLCYEVIHQDDFTVGYYDPDELVAIKGTLAQPYELQASSYQPLRCMVTNNPCGTDTIMDGYECPCSACQGFLWAQEQATRDEIELMEKREEGILAYLAYASVKPIPEMIESGFRIRVNPYAKNSVYWRAWWQGWRTAIKVHSEAAYAEVRKKLI